MKDSRFTIQGAHGLHEELQRLIAAGEPVELSLSADDRFDVAGLQVLMAAARSATARGVEFGIHADARVAERLRDAGLALHDGTLEALDA